jgi:hypothetical protein
MLHRRLASGVVTTGTSGVVGVSVISVVGVVDVISTFFGDREWVGVDFSELFSSVVALIANGSGFTLSAAKRSAAEDKFSAKVTLKAETKTVANAEGLAADNKPLLQKSTGDLDPTSMMMLTAFNQSMKLMAHD